MLSERSKQVRRDTIKLMYEHHGSHLGGSLSCIEILIALYDYVMTKDDVFLMSKGHSFWPVYVLLREKGLNPTINHHPHMDVANGINMTSGSLGHGLGFGIGVALSKKIKGEAGRVFVLCGEGDLQEGTAYESFLIAAQYNLNNLVVLVDSNKIQGSDFVNKTIITPYTSIAIQCGWSRDVGLGHDIDRIRYMIRKDQIFPDIIQCQTVKGRGISFMENKPEWHSRTLTESEYNQALQEL